jgi:hypothetical protein
VQVDQACFYEPQNFLTRADAVHPGKRYIYLTGKEASLTTQWKLPDGISCPDGCILQW